VRFSVIKGKDAGQDGVDASLTALSRYEADVKSPIVPDELSSIKLAVVREEGLPQFGDIYAKVGGGGATGFRIRFTALPSEAEAFVSGLLQGVAR